MALVVTINGDQVDVRDIEISAAQGNQDSLSCALGSADGSLFAFIDDEIIIEEDGTRLFGGTIKTPEIASFGDSNVATNTRIDAIDFNELATRQVIFGEIIPGNTSLRDAAEAILEYVPGVTIDPAWIGDGPDIGDDDLILDDITPADAFAALEQRSWWLHNITYYKYLRFFEPGTISAPWNISDITRNYVGRIVTSTTRLNYANRIIVRFSEAARAAYAFLDTTDNFSADDVVEVGGRDYVFVASLDSGNNNEVLLGDNATESLLHLIDAIMDNLPGAGTVYSASMTANGVVGAYLQSPTSIKAVALTPGTSGNTIVCTVASDDASWKTEGGGTTGVLAFGFDEGLTARVIVNDLAQQASYGIYTKTFEAKTVFETEAATTLGGLILEVAVVSQTAVRYATMRDGIAPGMVQQIQASQNNSFNASCLITEVTTRQIDEGGGPQLVREVSAVSGTVFKGSRWRDFYKHITGAGGGGGGNGYSGGIGGGGSTILGGGTVYPLQVSPSLWVQSPTPTWMSVYGAEGGLDFYIDTAVRGSATAMMHLKLRAQSGGVKARLWDITNSVVVGSPTALISTTDYTSVAVPIVLTTGGAWYRLEVEPSVAGAYVNVVGYLI